MGTNSSKSKSSGIGLASSPRDAPETGVGEKVPVQEESNPNLRLSFLKADVLQALADYLKEKKISEISLQRYGMTEVPETGILLKPLRMETMTTLALDFNQLKEVPDCLALQPMVSKVTLSHNRFAHTPSLGNTVTWLDLSWNEITVVDENVSQLLALRHLDLRHNRLGPRSLPDLSDLAYLEYLDLSENHLTSWPRLAADSPLKTLKIGYNVELGDPHDSFGPFPQMTHFSCTYTKLKIFPKFLVSSAESLITLNMSNTLVSRLPQSVSFSALTSLSLAATKFVPSAETSVEVHDPKWTPPAAPSDEVQASLAGLKNFEKAEFLDLSGIGLVHLPSSLFVPRAALTRLHLRWNNLFEIPEPLLGLTALESLDLMGNKISIIPPEISRLTALVHLSLGHNRLKTLPTEITTLSKLRTLVLEHNLWEDAKLESLYWSSDDVAPIFAHLLGQAALPAATTLPTLQGEDEAQLRDRVFGLIFGKALGDAVGLCSEFLMHAQASYTCPTDELDPMQMHRDRHRVRWLQGDWTDDTDQAILLLETLLIHPRTDGRLDCKVFARDLLQWAEYGFPELGDDGGMGIGQTVARVLHHPSFLTEPHAAASEVWKASGCTVAANGALMRCAPLALFGFWQNFDGPLGKTKKPKIGDAVSDLKKDAMLVRMNTVDACRVTHADPRCIASCLALNMAIVAILRGERDMAKILAVAEKEGLQAFAVQPEEGSKSDLYADWTKELTSLIRESQLDQLDLSDATKMGYTYKCLGAAFACFRTSNDFEQSIIKITLCGGDADTNGAVVGALLGAKLGFRALPDKWLQCLPHRDWLHQRAEQAWQHVKSQVFPVAEASKDPEENTSSGDVKM
jgi:ADP-ribosylglycohydrolase/Leucine-rich repeat (LRR) protein